MYINKEGVGFKNNYSAIGVLGRNSAGKAYSLTARGQGEKGMSCLARRLDICLTWRSAHLIDIERDQVRWMTSTSHAKWCQNRATFKVQFPSPLPMVSREWLDNLGFLASSLAYGSRCCQRNSLCSDFVLHPEFWFGSQC